MNENLIFRIIDNFVQRLVLVVILGLGAFYLISKPFLIVQAVVGVSLILSGAIYELFLTIFKISFKKNFYENEIKELKDINQKLKTKRKDTD